MKNKIYLLTAFCILFAAGCGAPKDTALEIGKVRVTKAEFDRAFKDSRYASTEGGREAFLESYINKKLLLLEAEAKGLDKDPEFLSQIQTFWETALLREVLSEKSKEVAAATNITEAQVRAYYQRNKEKFFADKDLTSVRDQIKWSIIQGRQSWLMDAWLKVLREGTNININYDRLGITE